MIGIKNNILNNINSSLFQTTVTTETVNNDINLQLFVVKFYYKKTKEWIQNYELFKKFNIFDFRSKKGKKFIHNLLSYIVKKYSINWYDLRKHHKTIKSFIYHKLKKF